MPPTSRVETAPRLQVLHFTGYSDDRSGIATVIREIAAADRFDCVLGVAPGYAPKRAAELLAIDFPTVAPDRIALADVWRARGVARRAAEWLRADPLRVFHGHSRAGLLAALWLAHWGERRVVATVHVCGRQRWFYRWASRTLAGRLYWLSPSMKAYYGIGSRTWDNCLPNAIASPMQPRAPRLRSAGRLMIGGAGHLVRWKGWHVVLEALARLPQAQRTRIEFRHIGASDGSGESRQYAAELVRRTAELGLDGTVHWLGWQPSSAGLLAEVDAVAVTSRQEPFSMIALEALFAGVPVIAADDGGPRDFVREGECGWFFRSGDPQDLARVIGQLLEVEAWKGVHIEPRELTRFTASVAAETWLHAYRGVMGGPPLA